VSVHAWHFLQNDGKLRYPPRTKVEVGQPLTCDGPPSLCKHGFHASRRAIDALSYAPDALACRVIVGGEIHNGNDKLAGTQRTVIAMADATMLLHAFACDVAEKALDERGDDDPRSRRAIEVKRLWIAGKATDSELDDAVDAAGYSASYADWYAAWNAARYSARCDAVYAARHAARCAAAYAARRAAWYADRDAAIDVYNADLEQRLFDLLEIKPEISE